MQVRLVVEVIWPLFLFFILVGVRSTNKPVFKGQCKYAKPLSWDVCVHNNYYNVLEKHDFEN